MNIQEINAGDLIFSEYNPRELSQKEQQDIKASIEKFGLVQPIVVNSNPARKNIVIGGHQRLRIAREMGIKTVPVFFIDIAELAKEQELNLRLNKNTAHWDYDALANLDEELLLDVGFTAKELDDIFDLEPGDDQDGAGDGTGTGAEPRAKHGLIYQLGQHRLMCGDSTDPADIARLMGDQKADMVFTDPPYNVAYQGRGENTQNGIANDDLTDEGFQDFCSKVFANLAEAMRPGAVFYICSGWSSYPVFHASLGEQGMHRAGVIIWVKNSASMGWNDYRYKHEWILVGKKKENRVKGVSILYGWKKGTHFFRDTRDEVDVWEVPKKASSSYTHPTEKPIWLIEKALANSSERGHIVLDLFGGSGSTLIACERLNRSARLMEFDPKYVDGIIERYAKFTKQKPEDIHSQAEAQANQAVTQ